jgi:hypothetical protein
MPKHKSSSFKETTLLASEKDERAFVVENSSVANRKLLSMMLKVQMGRIQNEEKLLGCLCCSHHRKLSL